MPWMQPLDTRQHEYRLLHEGAGEADYFNPKA